MTKEEIDQLVRQIYEEYIFGGSETPTYGVDFDKKDILQALEMVVQKTNEYWSGKSISPKPLLTGGSGQLPLPSERFDAEEWLGEQKDIWNHPQVTDRNNKNSYEVADLMAEFANWYYNNSKVTFNSSQIAVGINVVTQQQTNVMGSVFLVYNPNRHVIAVCSNYKKAEEIFRSEFGDLDPSIGIEEMDVDVKHCP